jgi:hypothetical protein
MQWVLLYLPIGHENISHSTEHQHACTQQLLQIMKVGACKPMWLHMRAYQTIANNPCPHIIAELFLVLLQL